MRWYFTFSSIFCLWLISIFFHPVLALDISIITCEQNLQNNISSHAISDFRSLLTDACNCEVKLNNKTAEVQLTLPKIDEAKMEAPSRFEQRFDYPYLHYPNHDYTWTSKQSGDQIVLTLSTPSYQGISNALYGLLQEQLGFLFYHPKETIIPEIRQWPMPAEFEWKAKARFDKKGFHLHTQHPLELTEPLMNPDFPDGLKLIKEYIDWLARNQQNYFEFNLLEGIDLEAWPAYAKQFVDYGHSRGILMGVDISLHMIQQKSFMLYENPPNSFRTKKRQIDRNLKKLFVADWDVMSVEFSTTEFTGGNVKKKQKIRLYLTDQITNKYGAFITGRQHVVKASEEIGSGNAEQYEMSAQEKALDQHRGTLIHTVMFYSISEPHAPVYGNENFQHMLDLLIKEKDQRETWYYPESAYWITFDNSVPMFLLPYLSARLSDILLMDSLGIPGHLTFSSGWEWGYWLFDWSIARWSWEHTWSGKKRQDRPTMFLEDIFKNKKVVNIFEESLELQNTYLKKKNLIQYMAAQTVTDELPPPLSLQLQPRPDWTYKWFRYNADMALLDEMKLTAVEPLLEFYEKANKLATTPLYRDQPIGKYTQPIFEELIRGLKITALRAKHKANTLSYLISKRRSDITGQKVEDTYLENAIATRKEAQQLVNEQEDIYRYPVKWIARKHWSHTAYNFGYLYPASNLHFWYREEEQVRKDKYGPLFMSIWNITRIIGLAE